MSTTTRQYLAKHIDPETGAVLRERIIDAANRISAMNHAANTTISIELLGVADARRLASTPVEMAVSGKASSAVAHPDQGSLSLPPGPPPGTPDPSPQAAATAASEGAGEATGYDPVDAAVADLTDTGSTSAGFDNH